MKKFSGVQSDILKANKKNQLVSAGAGSGKTTVMIEKISQLILSGEVDVDNLLVVTFTVLAAREMKERLIKKLKDEILVADDNNKQRILNIIEKIDTANIDTIDGFTSKTIKKYFYDLEISPNIEIISDATKDYYLTKAMNAAFSNSVADEDIYLMLDVFGGNRRNLDSLKELVLSSYYSIINEDNYEKFLEDCVDEYRDSVKSENVLNIHLMEIVDKALNKIRSEFSFLSTNVQNKLLEVVSVLEQFNKNVSFKTNLKVLKSFESIRFGISDYKANEGLKDLTKTINEVNEFKNLLEKNEIDEKYEEKNEKIIKYLLIFIKLLKNFIKNYNKIKEKNNLIDFNDLNRLMLNLLKNEKIKLDLQNKFKYIFIDEYQDVNPLQDKLMGELVGENTTIFMVGDVKQSIYGFRGSSPEWFLKKYNKMKRDKENEDVFDMNINFRSSPTILNFINEIFNKLMTKEITDIDYKNDCEIEPKRDDIVDEKVKILLIEDVKNNEIDKGLYSVKNHSHKTVATAKEKEAMAVAKTITELVGKDFYDANLKEVRKLTYKDFAILTHSDKDENSKILIECLKNNAIPVGVNNKLDISNSESVKLILSILKCVANTADDVDYLATFMSLTDLTIDDIVSISDKNFSFYENLRIIQENLIKNEVFTKINSGFEILEDLLNASFVKTNKELILYILNQKKLRYYFLQKDEGEKELKLLEEFIETISMVEDSLGLAEFIEVVESNVTTSGDFVSFDQENCVTIQTIHKSKGLEYPVVILFNSSKMFSHLRENESINFNSNIGFGFDYYDTSNRVKTDSIVKLAIKLSNNLKGYKEELSLLYVALTRAKNKLIITGIIPKKDFSEIKKTNYTNMILSCFADQLTEDGLEKENFKIEFCDDDDLSVAKTVKEQRRIDLSKIDFSYPNREKFNIPFKNTVTGINSENNQKNGFVAKQMINKSIQYEVEDMAKTGVNYHTALENLDLMNEYKKTTDFKDVDYNKIKLAHEVLQPLTNGAINIRKEADFMMLVPYSTIAPSDIEDKVLIQGVVDLIIEKENSIILVDYKFSRLPAKVLKEKYSEQLSLYKYAIEEAFKKPVENMFIYSINTGELV